MSSTRLTRLLAGALGGLLLLVAAAALLLTREPSGTGPSAAPGAGRRADVSEPAAPADIPLRPLEWVELLGRLRDEERNAELVQAVAVLEEESPELLAANDLYGLAADAARDAGDRERALRFYRLARRHGSSLADALMLRELRVLAELGKGPEAEALLQEMRERPSARPLLQEAWAEVPRAWKQAGDPSRAATELRAMLSGGAATDSVRLELARVELARGAPKAAAAVLAPLLSSSRLTLGKVEALELMRHIEKTHPETAQSLSAAENLKRGDLFFKSGHFDEAVEELEAAARKGNDKIASEARYLLGRVEYRRERFEAAVERYLEGIRHHKAAAYQQQNLSQAARCLLLLGRQEEAAKMYRRVIALAPERQEAAWARYELAVLQEKDGKLREALAEYQKLAGNTRQKTVASSASIQVVRLQAELGQHDAAVASARKMLSALKGSPQEPEARLYIARELERAGRPKEALAAYQDVTRRLRGTLHEWLARQALARLEPASTTLEGMTEAADAALEEAAGELRRARELGLDLLGLEQARPWLETSPAGRQILEMLGVDAVEGRFGLQVAPAPVFETMAERSAWLAAQGTGERDSSLARARLHLRLRQFDAAAGALEQALAAAPGDVEILSSLAAAEHRAGRPHRGLRYAERVANMLPGPPERMPRVVRRELYPWPYSQTMEELGRRLGVEPLLAIAVIRQESRYDPGAKSLAAARGLMQVVPVTFELLSRQLGREDLKIEDLHRPEIGIEMGMTYLRSLGERYGGRPEVVLAAYNAGPENAERWLEQVRGDDLLDYLAVISFKETRDYVRIVMNNWRIYHELYRGSEPPRRMLTDLEQPEQHASAAGSP
jgi:soluble lytic murein transglycosylase